MSGLASFHVYVYGPERGPLGSRFDEARHRLSELAGLDFEPDGSFVWAPGAGQSVFGMLYDAADEIQYSELRGCCDRDSWLRICRAVGGRSSPCLEILQLPQRRLQDLQSFVASQWSGG